VIQNLNATFNNFALSFSQIKSMRFLLFILALLFTIASCKKDSVAGVSVEMYLLKSYSLVPGKCQVDAGSATLQTIPFIKNEDIIEYSRINYTYKLTDTSFQKINTVWSGQAFAVTVDKQVIFYGIFKPSISSSSCEHSVTMDFNSQTDHTIILHLGYPNGSASGTSDQRNNAKILNALRAQGKLR
jgi:hypothetical protein